MKQWINQPITNHSRSRSTNRSMSQSISEPTIQSINHWVSESISPSISQQRRDAFNQSANQQSNIYSNNKLSKLKATQSILNESMSKMLIPKNLYFVMISKYKILKINSDISFNYKFKKNIYIYKFQDNWIWFFLISNKLIEKIFNQWVSQLVDQLGIHSINDPVNQSISQSVIKEATHSINQSIKNQSVIQTINQAET